MWSGWGVHNAVVTNEDSGRLAGIFPEILIGLQWMLPVQGGGFS